MVDVDTKSLLLRLNGACTTALQSAAGLCVSRTHYEVTVEHFLISLLDDDRGDVSLLLKQFDIPVGQLTKMIGSVLEEFKTGNSAKPVFSPRLLDLFQDAWMISSIDLEETQVRSMAVLMAIVAKPALYTSGHYVDLLAQLKRDELVNAFWTIAPNSSEKTAPAGSASKALAGVTPGSGGVDFLAKYCTDFTAKAKDGDIDPVFGRDDEIRQMIDVLARRRKNNPICVGEPGVGKTAVVEGLALRITLNDVPELLQGVTLLGLDMGLLEAGAGMKGEFENRLQGVINAIKSSETPIVLFIDEAHTLIGAGGSAGSSDAANLLKPALARGELRTVAATTWTEYKKYFEKDPALARRFQPIKLDEPDVDTATLILRGLKNSYESVHRVIVQDDAVVCAAEFSDRYIAGRFLPDKAIDLIDTACARVKISQSTTPPKLEDMRRSIQACERKQGALLRDKSNRVAIDEDALTETNNLITELTKSADELEASWTTEKNAANALLDLRSKRHELEKEGSDLSEIDSQMGEAEAALKNAIIDDTPMVHLDVTPDVVAQVVSDWTGIPLGKMLRDEAETIINLESKLMERVKGQDHAFTIMGEVIRSAKAGIKNPNQPMGVFLLVGPSGVGKTESALSVADLLFGSEKNVVTINMSEFQEKHTVSRLIGSPPGYVGYGEGGMLTEAVRQKPYSVVLLDEVEKSHPDVLNLFYQVFDKGMLTDGEGKEINFKNTIIILTSNLASDVIQEMTADTDEVPIDALTSAIRPLLSEYFKPALLARMTVIPYISLNKSAMTGIVVLKMNKVKEMLFAQNKMAFTWTDAVVNQIAERCTEVETGARNIDFILNTNILPKLSQTILTRMADGNMPESVFLDVDDDGKFSFNFNDD